MTYDALEALRAGGNPVDVLNEKQRGVLSTLSQEEVATINKIKSRLDAVSGEVQGQDINNII